MFVSVPAVGVGGVATLLLISRTGVDASSELRIHSASEFIAFAKDSSDYSGTTVYLESDLDFSGGLSEQFKPKDKFIGVFDGQGHTISNLKMKSSSRYVGFLKKQPEQQPRTLWLTPLVPSLVYIVHLL